MSTRRFLLEPVDCWFFRDGHPFNADDEGAAEARSIFPPNPEVVVGALRASLARNQGWKPGQHRSWEEVVPDITRTLGASIDDCGQLSFGEPVVVDRRARPHRLYPVPKHLARELSRRLVLLAPASNPGEPGWSDLGERARFAMAPGGFATPVGAMWLGQASFEEILGGEADSIDAFEDGELFARERRVGIGRDTRTRAVQRGQLYAATLIRPKPYLAIGIEVDGLPDDWQPEALGLLGGGLRLAHIEEGHWDEARLPQLSADDDGKWRFVVVLTGPMYPADDSWAKVNGSLSLEVDAGEVASLGPIVAACVGRPVMIGGWDSLNRAPREMRPCLGAGSVFFIESSVPPPAPPHRLGRGTRFGYGRCVLGRWPQWKRKTRQ